MQSAERKALVGSPDLESLTTSHIERAFLTVRQELKRFQRKGLGYSKDLATHTAAVAMPRTLFTLAVGRTPGTNSTRRPNQTMQRTAYRRDATLSIANAFSLQIALALVSGR
jgi:hypothetical protein